MFELNDLDHLAARLHGRHSRMAGKNVLFELCGLASPAELAARLFPGSGISSSPAIQRRLEADFFLEINDLARSLGKARGAFLYWLAERLQAENIKVAVRRVASGAPPEEAGRLMAGARGSGLAETKTQQELLAALPDGPLRGGLAAAYRLYQGKDSVFFLEAAVDRAYLSELLARAAALPPSGREAAVSLAALEADIFHLALVARGRFFHGFEKKDLLPLHVPGSNISRRRFARMLAAPDLGAARELAAARMGGLAGPAADLERSAWLGYVRLAERTFRGSSMDFGLVAGYAALRRAETASLITVAEGLRLTVPAPELRALVAGQEEADV